VLATKRESSKGSHGEVVFVSRTFEEGKFGKRAPTERLGSSTRVEQTRRHQVAGATAIRHAVVYDGLRRASKGRRIGQDGMNKSAQRASLTIPVSA
jgi:hypothetical protein